MSPGGIRCSMASIAPSTMSSTVRIRMLGSPSSSHICLTALPQRGQDRRVCATVRSIESGAFRNAPGCPGFRPGFFLRFFFVGGFEYVGRCPEGAEGAVADSPSAFANALFRSSTTALRAARRTCAALSSARSRLFSASSSRSRFVTPISLRTLRQDLTQEIHRVIFRSRIEGCHRFRCQGSAVWNHP